MGKVMPTKLADSNKKIMLSRLMVLVGSYGALFFLLNLVNYRVAISAIELAGVVFIFWMYQKVQNARLQSELACYATVFAVTLFCVIVVNIAYDHSNLSAYTWVYTIPVTSYLLLGTRRGFIVTSVFMAIVLLIYICALAAQQKTFLSAIETPNILISLFTVWLLSHIYELSNASTKWQLKQRAHTDPLTGLLNRFSLQSKFDKGIASNKSSDNNASQAIVVLDIDFFKHINDKYGHDVGDKVLTAFSEILKQQVSELGHVFRLGGEEFCILLPNHTADEAKVLTQGALDFAKKTGILPLHPEIRVSFSAGVACFPQDGVGLSRLLNCADRRMYAAKEAGKGRVVANGACEQNHESLVV